MIYHHKMRIYRPITGPNENGVMTTTFKEVSQSNCHLSVKSISSGLESPMTAQKQEFKVFCPIIDIEVGDKLVIDTGYHIYEFKAHHPFMYKLLKKLEVVVDQWQE